METPRVAGRFPLKLCRLNQPFKQLLMNFLRASPDRPCDEAKPLQLFIFSCWGVNFFVSALAAGAGAASAGLALRQSSRNFLYASPLRPLAFASALQVFIFSCCGVAASAGTDKPARAINRISFL